LAFRRLKVDKTVLRLDQNQPEFTRAIWKYIEGTVSRKRIKKGRKILKQRRSFFEKLTEIYHVPAEIILAIWAMESDFGANYGSMNVVRSLATLAYDGKRKEFAQNELLAALRIMVCENVAPKAMVGSWAGAIGHPQFMPTSYQRYAVDFDGDAKRDLWGSLDDSFASIANYMQGMGWNEGEKWGVEVSFPKSFDWQKYAETYDDNTLLSLDEWKKWGVYPLSKQGIKGKQFGKLFFPAGYLGPVFLTFKNFDMIKKYNASASYSLAVSLLSTGMETGKTPLKTKWPYRDKLLSHKDKLLLQMMLNGKGFNAGKVDGKLGAKTASAVRKWQLTQGLAADGYMNLSLFDEFIKSFRE
ncbi:MAG: lytic murein transglycosylase, partial [Cocleimonas sp.]|nr:lytic murein transglycosylase [Cocleimonas sp.]